MADTYAIRHNPETGQNFVKLRGSNEYQPVSDADLDILEENGVEAFVKSAGASLAQIPTGVGAIVGNEGARGAFDELTRQQELRQSGSPGAGMLGAVAPDVAIGAVTGGTGTLAKRVGTTAIVEGALQGARTPDNPLGGFAVGAGAGALGGALGPAVGANMRMAQRVQKAIVDRSPAARLRRGNEARTAQDQSMGAADASKRAPGDTQKYEPFKGQRNMRGMWTADEMEGRLADVGLDPALRKGDRMMLDAVEGTDDYAKAVARREAEELYSTDILQDRLSQGTRGSASSMKENLDTFVNRSVARELGLGGDAQLTSEVMREAGEELGRGFEDAAKTAGDLSIVHSDVQKMRGVLSEVTSDNTTRVQHTINNILEDAEWNEAHGGGSLHWRDYADTRTKLSRKAVSNRNSDPSYSEALFEVIGAMDDIVERQLRDAAPGSVEDWFDVRYRYQIFKAMESGRTTGGRGDVNLPTLINNLQKGGNRYFRGKAWQERGAEFAKDMETARALTEKVLPSSGTAERLIAKLPYVGGAAALGGATVLGFE